VTPQNGFFLLVFLSFVAPKDSIGSLAIGNRLLTLTELGSFGLLIIAPFLPKVWDKSVTANFLRSCWWLFCGSLLVTFVVRPETEFLTRTCRYFFPFTVASFFIAYPPKIDGQKLLFWLCAAIALSSLAGISIYLTGFEYYYVHEDRELSSTIVGRQARFTLKNFAFGVIGLFLLLLPTQTGVNQYLKSRTVTFASLVSIAGIVAGFNRTYMALILGQWFLLQLIFKRNIATAIKALLAFAIAAGTFWLLYESNDAIKRQVDKRILDVQIGRAHV
jgi:hypothetical protein